MIVVPCAAIEQIFIDHFLGGKMMRDIAKSTGYSDGVLQRAVKSHHRTIRLWAKPLGLPYVDFTDSKGNYFVYSARDSQHRILASSNRENNMFRRVLGELSKMSIDPVMYIKRRTTSLLILQTAHLANEYSVTYHKDLRPSR